ncbi:hypothetical protein evm_003449 [Chilo suppressalis]|nr:hypothetical protein evm_003449 [Chilo suppressalis]
MFAIYIMGRVLQWIEKQGGLDAMAESAQKKSTLIYNIIEESNGFYYAPVAKNSRSRMNIPFRIGSSEGNDALEKEFLKGAEAMSLIQLQGHRSVGGIRASTYNAVTLEEVQTLAKYMKDFYAKHAKMVILFLVAKGTARVHSNSDSDSESENKREKYRVRPECTQIQIQIQILKTSARNK